MGFAFSAALSFNFQFFAPLSTVGRTVPEGKKEEKKLNQLKKRRAMLGILFDFRMLEL